MTDYSMPANALRVRYFDGQYLQDQDFIDEQNYQRDREHRHLRQLHGPGITDGLAVTATAPNQATVAPGTAIDGNGYQLVLTEDTTVDLTSFTNVQGVSLYLSYNVTGTQPQGSSGGDTRWQESPQLTPVGPGGTLPASPANPDFPGVTPPPVLLALLNLDNEGNVTVDGSVRGYAGLLLPGPEPVSLQATAAGPVHLAGSLSIDGSVGIATASATGGLTVGGDGSAGIATSSPAGGLTVGSDGSVGLAAKSATGGLTVGSDGSVGIAAKSPGGGLAIDSNGNVGIGATPSSSWPVWVAPGKALRIEAGNGPNDTNTYFSFGGNGQFSIDAPSVPGGRFVVTNDGNVGIGTASPENSEVWNKVVDILGPGNAKLSVRTESIDARVHAHDAGWWGSAPGMVIGTRTAHALSFGTSATTQMTITPDGNVGLGMNDPQTKLHVGGGDTLIDGNLFVTGRIGWQDPVAYRNNGWNTAGGVWTYIADSGNAGSHGAVANFEWPNATPSDLRLKTDLRPVSHALDMVKELHGVHFRWGELGLSHFTRDIESRVCAGPGATEEENRQAVAQARRTALHALAGDRIGVVAQDVEAVLPELVCADDDGYKYVSYQHMTAVLIEAIKELDAAVAALSARIAAPQAGQAGGRA